MKQKLFLVLGLISLWGFVNCTGPFKKEEKNKDVENLILLEVASKEDLAINGTWVYTAGGNKLITEIFGKKSLLFGTYGDIEFMLRNSDNLSLQYFMSYIVDFNNQNKTYFTKYNEDNLVDCNGDGDKTDEGACFGRSKWTIKDGVLYLCTEAYIKASLDEAKNDPATADPDNLNTGCPTGMGGKWGINGTKQ